MEGVCVARGWGAVRSVAAGDTLRIGGGDATRLRPILVQPFGTSAFAAGRRRSSLTMRMASLRSSLLARRQMPMSQTPSTTQTGS
jgi:hypothetical protein